ncbi:ABC transporter substrate-binding protein [Alkalihalobacillus deserti]|uniref:ABC transporter substrate-binding protein n=1 Tax=Alkalihalobacillus deserti TaxID=2879466 RepID=UPI001D134241|nr:ABC transporter substrate-binding protein [Alkalihalobacillus deserti]
MKQLKLMLIALLMAIFVAGCGQDQATEPEQAPDTDVEVSESTDGQEQEGSYPLTITDALGDEVTIEAQPERIVSLIPSITETVFAVEAGDAVVGRTDWDNYPEAVLDIESVGDMNFDVEKVLALSPDLVLSHASNAHSSEEGLNQIRNAGIPVVVVHDAKSIDMVYNSIELIGQVTGHTTEADAVISDMQETFAAVEAKASEISEEDRKKVWVEVSPAPEIYTTGQGTFLDEMLTIINAENAAGEEEGWPMFTEEEAVAFNPDVILITYGYYVENAVEGVMERAAWKDVPAVVNERIYDLDSDEVTRSGPRLAKGVERIAKAVYPEVFGE